MDTAPFEFPDCATDCDAGERDADCEPADFDTTDGAAAALGSSTRLPFGAGRARGVLVCDDGTTCGTPDCGVARTARGCCGNTLAGSVCIRGAADPVDLRDRLAETML